MSSSNESPQGYRLPVWVIVIAVLPLLILPWLKRSTNTNRDGSLIGSTAPNLTFVDPDGKSHDLTEFRGKTVLLNFWASWCGPCMEEMPSLRALEDKLKNKPFSILAMNVEELKDEVLPRLRPSEFPTHFYFGVSESQLGLYQVGSIPVSFLIDPKGQIQKAYLGPRPWSDESLVREIESSLR